MAVDINFLAVLVNIVIAVALGFAWYGPLFGKAWMRLSGISMDSKPSTNFMVKAMVITIIGAFFMNFALAHNLTFGSAYLNIYGVAGGLQAGFWNWLGFVAPVTVSSVLWEGKSWKLWVLNNAYWLILLLISGVILAVWQ